MAIQKQKNEKLSKEEQADSELKKREKSFIKKVKTELRLKGLPAAQLTMEYYQKHPDITYNEKLIGLNREQIVAIYKSQIDSYKQDLKIKKALNR